MLVSIVNNLNYNDQCLQSDQQQNTKQPKKHICPIENCTKSYEFNSRLKDHILTHKNERTYKCSACDNRFNTSNQLNAHEKTHGNKIYKCDTCNIAFTNKKYLKQHAENFSHQINIKYIKKHYFCGQCTMPFTNKTKLNRHFLEAHNIVIAFSCVVCNKSYRSEGGVKRHYRTTHTDKVKHIKDGHKGQRLLEISNQKTISNNDNQNVCQDNNQDNLVDLIDDSIMPDIKTELKADNTILDVCTC
jgi:uncharacterized Zn-finger protein